tara:strand:- start:8 stop:190 length:183 start_codon:yes stop_codon:yes gene_type:complete
MIKKIDFKYLVGALGSLSLGLLTMMGVTQQYIPFAGIDNEMGFSLLTFWMGFLLLFCIKK